MTFLDYLGRVDELVARKNGNDRKRALFGTAETGSLLEIPAFRMETGSGLGTQKSMPAMAALRVALDDKAFATLADAAGFDRASLPDDRADLWALVEQATLSPSQKVALLGAVYLYRRIDEGHADGELTRYIGKRLGVPEDVLDSCQQYFTAERIDFIRADLKLGGRQASALFTEPQDYVLGAITGIAATPAREEKKALKKLLAAAYEHPSDRHYLDRLKGNSALEKIMKLYSQYGVETLMKIQYTGSNILVTEKNLPYLHRTLQSVCETLNVADVPPLYVTQGLINAWTIGSSKPIIVIASSCLSFLTHDELVFLLGHEVGHIKSQHVLYHSIGRMLPSVAEFIGNLTLGIGEVAAQTLMLSLYNWQRNSEFTADRAGLLACQSIEAATGLMTKLAGFPPSFYDQIDPEHILEQADRFEDLDQSRFEKYLKYYSAQESTHPWTIMRAKEMKRWIDSGDYERIVNPAEWRRQMNERRRDQHVAAIGAPVPAAVIGIQEPAAAIAAPVPDSCTCMKCGFTIMASANFCKKCGAPNLAKVQAAQAPAQERTSDQEQAPIPVTGK